MLERTIAAIVLPFLLSLSALAEFDPDIHGYPSYLVEPSDAAKEGFKKIVTDEFPVGPPFGTISQEEFENLWKVWPEEWASLVRDQPKSVYYDVAFARYGYQKSPYRDYTDGNAPMAFAKKKNGRWEQSCLLCHSHTVNGEMIVGAPNPRVEVSNFYFDRLAHHEKFPWVGKNLVEKFTLDLAIATLFNGVEVNHIRGSTDVWVVGLSFMSHRTKDFGARLLFPPNRDEMFEGYISSNMDPRPWWFAGIPEHTHIWVDGWAPKTSKFLLIPSMPPTIGKKKIRKLAEGMDPVLEAMKHMEPPKYPREKINPQMADAGYELFDDRCASCHGVYQQDGTFVEYPFRTVSLEKIGTDPTRIQGGLTDAYKEFARDSWMGDYGKADVVVSRGGYIAPPLKGIWASAPYLHNGSVPTLYHHLFPDERPKVWTVTNYDQLDEEKMGFTIREYDELPGDLTPEQARSYYDTEKRSQSNSGHEFYRGLSREDRLKILEFLKRL